MRILSQKLPRDIIRHCIQPYLMKCGRQVSTDLDQVLKQVRELKECCKCYRIRKRHGYYQGYVCYSCFGSKFQIINEWTGTLEEPDGKGKIRYVIYIDRLLVDEKGVVHKYKTINFTVEDWRKPKFHFLWFPPERMIL